MSIRTAPRRVTCDHLGYARGATTSALDVQSVPCLREYVGVGSAAQLRKDARAAGWIRGNGKDFCPSHGQALRIRDTGSAYGRTR